MGTTLLLVLVLAIPFAVYSRWRDICRSIVNTGMAADQPKELTPVEKLHAAMSPTPADPTAAAISGLLAARPASK